MVSSVEKSKNPTNLHPTLETEKQKQEKQEAGVSQVKSIKIPLTQQSASEEGEIDLTVIEVIQESITLLSNKKSSEDKGMNTLQELKDESCNDKNSKVSTVVEVLEKPALAQSAVEFHQNGHDNGAKISAAEEAIEGLSDSQSLNRVNMALMVEANDKSWSIPIVMFPGEIEQQTQNLAPKPFVSPNMIEDIAQVCNIHNKEIAIASMNVDSKDIALQSQNYLHSKDPFMEMTEGDRINNFESKVDMADASNCSISRIQFDSSETKDNSNEVFQSLECLNKMDAPQKQEDINQNSSYEMENKDVNRLTTDTRSLKEILPFEIVISA